MKLKLSVKQTRAILIQASQVLYGGAAGGGKSVLLRVLAIKLAIENPGINIYLFRRRYPDLWRNHLEGPTSFFVLLGDALACGAVVWNASRMMFAFGNGSVLLLSHCKDKNSVENYHGAEIHALLIDEVTQFTEYMFRYLRTRVRLGSFVPAKATNLPLIFCCCNPIGIGHAWAKALFVDPCPKAGAVWISAADDGARTTAYIEALHSDNPHLDANYATALDGVGSPELANALKNADWNSISGTRYGYIWDAKVHLLDHAEIPKNWAMDRSYDHGESAPFSVCWWAESPGDWLIFRDGSKKFFPRGSLIMFAEWYGWNGRPNKGIRMLGTNIAKGILSREKAMGYAGRVGAGPADTNIWTRERGSCTADDMRLCGITWTRADKAPGSRVTGWQQVGKFLTNAIESPETEPGLYAFRTCVQYARTFPILTVDPANPDDVDTDCEDHIADAVRYRVRKGLNHVLEVRTGGL